MYSKIKEHYWFPKSQMEALTILHSSNYWIVSLAKDKTTEFCTKALLKYSEYLWNNIDMWTDYLQFLCPCVMLETQLGLLFQYNM